MQEIIELEHQHNERPVKNWTLIQPSAGHFYIRENIFINRKHLTEAPLPCDNSAPVSLTRQ